MAAADDDMDIRIALKNTPLQRDAFRAHSDTLTAEALKLREQCNTFRSSCMRRRQHAGALQWAAKLEQAEHEFSDMLTPEDLTKMRLELVEQAEARGRRR